MTAPAEAPGLVPNWDRLPGERYDIRPHGTEARARRGRSAQGHTSLVSVTLDLQRHTARASRAHPRQRRGETGRSRGHYTAGRPVLTQWPDATGRGGYR